MQHGHDHAHGSCGLSRQVTGMSEALNVDGEAAHHGSWLMAD